MRKSIVLILIASLVPVAGAVAAEAQIKSKHSLEETASRFVSVLNKAGVGVARDDTANTVASGAAAGKEATILFINPLYDTNIGGCRQGVRKDIPLEAHVREDVDGNVWLAYTTPDAPINQFGVIECGNEADKMRKLLGGFANSAAE